MTRRPLIAANWKMHGRKAWAGKPAALAKLLPTGVEADILICPPHPYVAMLANDHGILVGGQDCHADESGAHTGEVSAEMLADCGASHVIVGHSERRAAGESDADVRAKAEAALRAGLVPIVCVGETLERREAGQAESTVLAQLRASLPEGETVVAYEPVWAIGTGKVATPDDIRAMHAAIREVVGDRTRILYGGSVKPANARDVLATADVDGALVGGAGLEMESLAEIVHALP